MTWLYSPTGNRSANRTLASNRSSNRTLVSDRSTNRSLAERRAAVAEMRSQNAVWEEIEGGSRKKPCWLLIRMEDNSHCARIKLDLDFVAAANEVQRALSVKALQGDLVQASMCEELNTHAQLGPLML